ncbi:MAG: UvrD-helicase domain-containing protein [Clostridia bacterium]|nr:UvrD-helicase domain-containing protein [Clostridia bacterium]
MDFSKSTWGKILIEEFEHELSSCILELKSIKRNLDKFIELDKFSKTILNDIEKLEELQKNLDSWDKLYSIANQLKWETWPRDSKIVIEQKEISKEKRDNVKKKFNKIRDKILVYDSKQILKDLNEMYPIMRTLGNLVIEFSDKYQDAKKEKNIIDFNDIEHFALKLLIKKEDEDYIPTDVAKLYKDKFKEILIDEYQDSNLVQEYILNSVSNGNNIFMVGDVKQSIYKFRQARPELFIDKYENYKTKDELQENEGMKIQLFKNFRSRKNILDITNLVFENIMSKNLGDIDYNKGEFLNLGANYEEPKEDTNYAGKTELLVIDLKQKEDAEDEEMENVDDIVIESKLVAKKIQELINSKYQVFDKKLGYRNINYKDIVILLRATLNLAPIYEKSLNDLNIPVFSDTGASYLESVEIQTIMSLLKIIDNPMQDIPLVSVMRSPIGRI